MSCSRFPTGSLLTDLSALIMSFHYQTSLCLEHRKGCAISYFKLFLWIPTQNIKSQTLDMSFRNFTFWLEHHLSSLTVEKLRVRRLTRWQFWLSHLLTYLLLLSTELKSRNCAGVWQTLASCFNRQVSQILLSPLVIVNSERYSNLFVNTWRCLTETPVHLMLMPIL